ncbi:MAG TPA: acetyl-CoA hydrolase/transferase C-terminal domain-containing protein [Phaeodactylibacter sp.]|nr:acetyl-CoA hydrolase/transferase C-terminal domain-containing protein [Phaeodactylibacter sp.]
MNFDPSYTPVSPEEAVSLIQSNDKVFIHSAASAPNKLINALAKRGEELRNVEILHLHTDAGAPYADESLIESFRVNNLFVGGNVRKAVQEGRADYIPIFLSEVPLLFRRRIIPLDAALLQVSPPDKNGYCTLGLSVDTSLAAAQSAKVLIAEINPNMPRTHGDGSIHISKFDRVTEVDYDLPTLALPEPTDVEKRIGQHVANLVENGSTLQMGIGTIPNAALAAMENHKELGIHTEMFSDGIIKLVKKGVITNQHKRKQRNHIVTGFIMGSQELYDFVDDNPLVRVLDIAYVNDTATIRQNPKVVAINSAIEIDLTGQVCADSIGTRIYSGVGGQMDFIRGASLSEGGKPIIALPSTTRKGISRITSMLKPGAGVVTTRAHVHYIVTEYGVAEMFGKNLRQRAKQLIDIAHPDHREALEKEAFDQWHLKTWQ